MTTINVNINSLSIRELKVFAHEFFPGMPWHAINTMPLWELQSLVIEQLSKANIDLSYESEEDYVILKHLPSRKKKSKRVGKWHKSTTFKPKTKVKLIRIRSGEEDITNRSYCNKATKRYVPARKLY